jgi:hypothetical protein
MSEYLRVNDLAARKRALVEESDAQRELIVAELHNLQASAVVFQRRLKVMSTVASVLGVIGPIAGTFLRFRAAAREPARKVVSGAGLFGAALTGWRIYRKVAPVIQTLIARR